MQSQFSILIIIYQIRQLMCFLLFIKQILFEVIFIPVIELVLD